MNNNRFDSSEPVKDDDTVDAHIDANFQLPPMDETPLPSSQKSIRLGRDGKEYYLAVSIASGSSGIVWIAVDEAGQVFAVKEVKANPTESELVSELAPTKDLRDRGNSSFNSRLSLTEIFTLAISRGTHVAEIVDFGRSPGSGYFMVMPFYPQNLSGYLASKKSRSDLSLGEVASLFIQIAEGIQSLHLNSVNGELQPIVHRDLKPNNVFVDDNGDAKVGDLGLAIELKANAAPIFAADFCGTPKYAAPEQFPDSKRELTTAIDVWSIGVMLYEAVAGRDLFTGDLISVQTQIWGFDDNKILESSFENGRKLIRIAKSCLKQQPADRPSISELIDALKVAAKEEKGVVRDTYKSLENRMSRTRLLAITTTVLFALAFFALGIVWKNNSDLRILKKQNLDTIVELESSKQQLAAANSENKSNWQNLQQALSEEEKIKTRLNQELELKSSLIGDLQSSNYRLSINTTKSLSKIGEWTRAQAVLAEIPTNRSGWDVDWLRSQIPVPKREVHFKHHGGVATACLSSDGKRIYSFGFDGRLVMTELKGKQDQKIVLSGRKNPIIQRESIWMEGLWGAEPCFSGMVELDGKIFAVGFGIRESTGVLKSIDVETSEVTTLAKLEARPTCLARLSNNTIIVGLTTGLIAVYDVEKQKVNYIGESSSPILSFAHAGEDFLFIGREDGRISYLKSGVEKPASSIPGSAIWSLDFDERSSRLIVASNNSVPQVFSWSDSELKEVLSLSHPEKSLGFHSVAFSDDGDRIVGGSSDGRFVEWSTQTGSVSGVFDDQFTSMIDQLLPSLPSCFQRRTVLVAKDKEGNYLSAGADGSVKTIQVSKPKLIKSNKFESGSLFTFTGKPQRIWVAEENGELSIVRTRGWERVAKIQAHQHPIRLLANSENGSIATVSGDRDVRFWTATDSAIRSLHSDYQASHRILDVCLSPSGDRLAVFTDNREICIHNFRAENNDVVIATSLDFQQRPHKNVCCFDSSGNYLAIFGSGQSLEVYDCRTGALESQYVHGLSGLGGSQILADHFQSKSFIFGNVDGFVSLTNPKIEKRSFYNPVVALGCTKAMTKKDKVRIAAANSSGTIRILRYTDCVPIINLQSAYASLTNPIVSIEFSSDGRALMAGHENGQVQIWDISHNNTAQFLGSYESETQLQKSCVSLSGPNFQSDSSTIFVQPKNIWIDQFGTTRFAGYRLITETQAEIVVGYNDGRKEKVNVVEVAQISKQFRAGQIAHSLSFCSIAPGESILSYRIANNVWSGPLIFRNGKIENGGGIKWQPPQSIFDPKLSNSGFYSGHGKSKIGLPMILHFDFGYFQHVCAFQQQDGSWLQKPIGVQGDGFNAIYRFNPGDSSLHCVFRANPVNNGIRLPFYERINPANGSVATRVPLSKSTGCLVQDLQIMPNGDAKIAIVDQNSTDGFSFRILTISDGNIVSNQVALGDSLAKDFELLSEMHVDDSGEISFVCRDGRRVLLYRQDGQNWRITQLEGDIQFARFFEFEGVTKLKLFVASKTSGRLDVLSVTPN